MYMMFLVSRKMIRGVNESIDKVTETCHGTRTDDICIKGGRERERESVCVSRLRRGGRESEPATVPLPDPWVGNEGAAGSEAGAGNAGLLNS